MPPKSLLFPKEKEPITNKLPDTLQIFEQRLKAITSNIDIEIPFAALDIDNIEKTWNETDEAPARDPKSKLPQGIIEDVQYRYCY